MEDAQEYQGSREPLSVSAALALAKGALESFTLQLIGEVSEVSNKPGYKAVYFTVKDAQASLPCMMWLNRYQAAAVDIAVGMLVELTGRFTVYAPKGRMSFDVFGLTVAGEGRLRLQVANLAKQLQAEGLMRPERKRPVPAYPQRIGLVTSPRGAAVHDVLRTLRRRFPLAEVLFAGVAVEGAQAPVGLIEALHTVQEAGAEVVLLVRGGGSFEDLMPFNDEGLARAIAALDVPVVTGIGHEPDTSIADMVADLRASTPTAAAEAVSPAPEALAGLLASRARTLYTALSRRIEREAMALERLSTRPLFSDPNAVFALEAQMLDVAEDRLYRAIPAGLAREGAALEKAGSALAACGSTLLAPFGTALALKASRLHDLSPLAVLGRGFAIARDEGGAVLRSVLAVQAGDDIDVELSDGRMRCRVKGTEPNRQTTSVWEDNDG